MFPRSKDTFRESGSNGDSVPLSMPMVGVLCILFPGIYVIFYAYIFLLSGQELQAVFHHQPFYKWFWYSGVFMDIFSIGASIALIRLRAWGRMALECLLWMRVGSVLIISMYLHSKAGGLHLTMPSFVYMIFAAIYYLVLITLLRRETVRRAVRPGGAP